MFKVPVYVLDGYVYVLADFAGAWRPKLTALASEHNGAFSDCKLAVSNLAIASHEAEALGKSEGATEPIHGLADVLVDQNGDNRCGRCGPVENHGHLLGCRA